MASATRRHLSRIVLLCTAALIPLSGCGAIPAGPTPPSPGASVTPSPTPTPAGKTELTIVSLDAGGSPTTWRLACDPPGGDHPDKAAACTALDAHGAAALPPVAKDRMCTQIYGGPETATITGTWRGQPVLSTFSLKNGCEIARWKLLAGLLPSAGS